MPKGTIKWYDNEIGYGFIEVEEGYSLYMDESSISSLSLKTFHKGDHVTFEVGRGEKGPVALHVTPALVNKRG
jgi:CspA family cold shock protein